MLDLQELAHKISVEQGVDVFHFTELDNGAEQYAILDITNSQWRENLRDEILEDGDDDTAMGVEEDENDAPQFVPAITTFNRTLGCKSVATICRLQRQRGALCGHDQSD